MSDTQPVPLTRLREAMADLYRQVDDLVAPLVEVHADRLVCAPGCCQCCVDDLTVFKVEAENIRLHHGPRASTDLPHAPGACAFLDDRGQCRIYPYRPYVCRTQGLPLRWLEENTDGQVVEYRDICPLNDRGAPLEELAAERCWTLGAAEQALSQLQEQFFPGEADRIPLRSLFSTR